MSNVLCPNTTPLPLLVPLYGNMGNIVGYADVNGALVTHYIYDAFGKQLTMNNSELATCLTHRFSTKPYCAFTGLVHYQMRDYMPDIGRFISGDPIGEQGGLNLYCCSHNNLGSNFDIYGYMEGDVSYGGFSEIGDDFISDNVFGQTIPALFFNEGSCHCERNKWFLKFKLSIKYNIYIASKNSSVWKNIPFNDDPPFPKMPTSEQWLDMAYKKKRAAIVQHERTHVTIYRKWHEFRRSRIEAFESLQYYSRDECNDRINRLIEENQKSYNTMRKPMTRNPHKCDTLTFL